MDGKDRVLSPNDLIYNLNPDCTGTYTVLDGGPEFDIFVSPNGDEMTSIATAPKGNAGAFTPSRRVAPK